MKIKGRKGTRKNLESSLRSRQKQNAHSASARSLINPRRDLDGDLRIGCIANARRLYRKHASIPIREPCHCIAELRHVNLMPMLRIELRELASNATSKAARTKAGDDETISGEGNSACAVSLEKTLSLQRHESVSQNPSFEDICYFSINSGYCLLNLYTFVCLPKNYLYNFLNICHKNSLKFMYSLTT